MKQPKGKKFLTFILMVLAMNTIYVLPYLMYNYYTPLQEAMGLVGRDADYGKLLNVYGIANVILYLPGGWIADKFDPKKLLVFSMLSTGALGLWESFWPSYTMLMIIHVLWAVTTVLTFWSSSVKCINMLADSDEQGGMFGSLEALRGVSGLIVTTICVSLFNIFKSDSTKAMSSVVRVVSVIMILVGVALALLMPQSDTQTATNATLLDSIKAMGVAFKRPITYLLAGMIFCGSMTLASASYYAPYLQNFCGLPTDIAVTFTSYRAIVCQLIGASLAAVLATKMKNSSKPMIGAGIIGIVCFVGMLLIPASAAVLWPVMALTIVASMAVYVFRALYYATVDESGTPKNVVGSVIGIASLLGFLPDTFYTSLCGSWLDADPVGGYKNIFMAACAAMVLGLVCAFFAERLIKKYRNSASAAE